MCSLESHRSLLGSPNICNKTNEYKTFRATKIAMKKFSKTCLSDKINLKQYEYMVLILTEGF